MNVSWKTESEANNDYFVVERSKDGKDFEDIGRVEAAGNSSGQKNYSFTDTDPFSSTSYYRLKQVDFEGKFSFSQIKKVDAGCCEMQDFVSVYPNPAAEKIYISIRGTSDAEAEVLIVDMLGKKCFSKTIRFSSGTSEISVSGNDLLLPGIYCACEK